MMNHNVKLGQSTVIHSPSNLFDCEIGSFCTIGAFVEIGKAKIGNRCKIGAHSFICEGVTLEDEVFVGPGVTFTNDLLPRATTLSGNPKTEKDWTCTPTLIQKGASIGAGSTILCGIVIGNHAMVGAGSVVTKNVAPGEVVMGNPAE